MNTQIKQADAFGMVVDTDPTRLAEIKAVSSARAGGDCNNMLPRVDISIPGSVVLTCPMAKQHLSQAKNCIGCEHFNGIVQTGYNDEYVMQWDHKYAISCGFPVDRKCATVCISNEA